MTIGERCRPPSWITKGQEVFTADPLEPTFETISSLAPAKTAVRELLTAFSVSLWACIPIFFPGITLVTLFIISPTSLGKVPPLVSQRTTHLAPSS